MAALLRPVPVAPGHNLFPQRQTADCIYILQDGEMAREGPPHIAWQNERGDGVRGGAESDRSVSMARSHHYCMQLIQITVAPCILK